MVNSKILTYSVEDVDVLNLDSELELYFSGLCKEYVMQIGIKKERDSESEQYYNTYYDILRTPDFKDSSRLLKPSHGIQKIGSPHNKKCRFCGRDESNTSFTKIAHVFPECIGNMVLASNYECDECNQFFGNTIENEFANYFSLYHSIMQISGKNGKPKCCFKVPCSTRNDTCMKYCVRIEFQDDTPSISLCEDVDKKYINLSNNSIQISKPIGKHCPIAVFKAIVKMAITVMPTEELSLFSGTIKWLLEKNHSNIFNKKLLVRYKMIPGFNVTKFPHYILYRRKKTVWNKPYMLLNLTYGCFSLFVEIPRDNDCSSNDGIKALPFPPISFYTSTEGIWDLSYSESPENCMQNIILSFNDMKPFTLPKEK